MVNTNRPAILFAPGAGAPSSHPWMQRWAERLRALGDVRTFDFDYMRAGRRRPDPFPLLLAAHRAALNEMRRETDRPLVLAGKSMGGRIGCHLALTEPVAALICFGYPLCGGGDPARLRDKVLRELTTPILFLQGTRDPLCPLDLLEQVRAEMSVPHELFIVEGGDHSLAVAKKHLAATQQTQDEVDVQILNAIRDFLQGTLPPVTGGER